MRGGGPVTRRTRILPLSSYLPDPSAVILREWVADSAEGLLQAADAAMYKVKSSGKNGIHIAGSDTSAVRFPTEEQEPR